MRPTLRLLVPAICLVAALVCYLLSFQVGAGFFFAAGVPFEIVAWVMPRRAARRRGVI